MSKAGTTSVLRGAVLTVGMRWTDRLIGLISTLILARLLVPEDIGIIAMSSMVVALADTLLDLGVGAALIQNRNATREHFDSAWTIRLLQMLLSALLVLLASPLAGAWFNEPRVAGVLQVTALSLVLGGLENIGVVAFQKEMRFGKDFQFLFLKRILGFCVTMIAAFVLRNYWALVIGALAGRGFGVVLSYYIHPFRPRFSLSKGREIFGFSQWMLVKGIGGFIDGSLHRFLVGGRESATVMGGYSIAGEISAMPSTELLMPLNRVLFPRFVQAKKNALELKRVFLLAQGVQSLIAIPACVGLALVAKDAVPVLLGEKWLLAVPFVQIFAMIHVVRALTTSSYYVLMTLGQVARVAKVVWLKVLVFVLIAYLGFPGAGAEELAHVRALTVAFGLGFSFWLLRLALPVVTWGDFARTVSRPLLAVAAMGATLVVVDHYLAVPHIAALIVKIGVGALVYPSVLLLLWWAVRKPEGAESYLLRTLQDVHSRRSRVRSCKSA